MERNKMRVYYYESEKAPSYYLLFTKHSDVCYFFIMNPNPGFGLTPMIPKLMVHSSKGMDFSTFVQSILSDFEVEDSVYWISNEEFFDMFD